MKLKLGVLEDDVTKFFQTLVKDMMEQRKKSKTVRKDFMQLLIELKEKGSISMEDEDKHLETEVQNTSSHSEIF